MDYFKSESDIYYSIDHPLFQNVKFETRIAAIDATKGLGDVAIKFNWFPNLWKNYDYTAVSNKSYDQLKLERALRLREKYGYLKLYFSGGSDSISMLNTFIKNNIFVDEIINYKKSLGTFKNIDPDIENSKSALPYLKSIQHLIPKTKINVVNVSIDDFKTYNHSYGNNRQPERIIMGESAELDFAPDHKYLFLKDTRSNVGHIEGGQKPSIFRVGNKWYFGLYDISCTTFYNNGDDFFFDRDNPELFMKSVHELKTFMNHLLVNDYEKYEDISNNRNKLENRKELMPVIGRDDVYDATSLIKFHFNQDTGPSFKLNGNIIRCKYIRTYEVINTFINQNFADDRIANWKDNLNQLIVKYGDHLKTDRRGIPQPIIGFKSILSSLYNIDDKNDVIDSPQSVENLHQIVVL